MKVVIAPNAFKGSLSPLEAAEAMSEGVRRADSRIETQLVPLADGGDGTVETLVAATGGQLRKATVSDPLGRPVQAEFGILGDGKTAVIEMSSASGLRLLKPEEYGPLVTSTRGTGELVLQALDQGVSRIILGIGGSATHDGGMGMASALGACFLDANGRELRGCGEELEKLERIDLRGMDDRIARTEIQCACDVENPLVGPRGAAFVYSPQKGADSATVQRLERGLRNYAAVVKRDLGLDVMELPGSGAAGGLGAGILAFLGGRLLSGAELVIQHSGLVEHLEEADWVLTGEGRIDMSTGFKKVPAVVARLAAQHKVPVLCFGGSVAWDEIGSFRGRDFTALFAVTPAFVSLDTAIKDAARNLASVVEQVFRTLMHQRS